MKNRILRAAEISRITGLSISTIGRMEAIGKFPKRRKIGKNAVGWAESEIANWLNTTLTSNKRSGAQ